MTLTIRLNREKFDFFGKVELLVYRNREEVQLCRKSWTSRAIIPACGGCL